MKLLSTLTVLSVLVVFCFGAGWPTDSLGDDVNGGDTCLLCTLFVAIWAQMAQLYNETPEQAMDQFCGYFNTDGQELIYAACISVKDVFGDIIAYYLNAGLNPDEVCFAMDACTDTDGTMCRLFPMNTEVETLKKDLVGRHATKAARFRTRLGAALGDEPNICNLDGVRALCNALSEWGNDHLPVEDLDQDWFSTIPEMRGSYWRGKDCKDDDPDFYPGRRALNGDTFDDMNCNGIYGVDNVTGQSYEDMWCAGTGQMGTALLGDSAGAHFHIPPEWMNVTEMTAASWADTYFILLMELDWPFLSGTTAIFNSTQQWQNVIQGPVDSLYMRLRQQNRCNHRDYQNLGVNGARSGAMADQLDQTLRRDATKDHPVMLVYELIGNDVCNGHHTFQTMTTPEEFYQNNLKAFQYLDSKVPYGSRILAFGLANGSILYDAMSERIHPIGALNNDVTYKAVYDYLNCLYISPCWGWMNSNATVRDITTQKAEILSATLQNLTENVKFENMTVQYMSFVDLMNNVIAMWQAQGGETWQLIEPVDGFHPNQLSNALLADVIWKELEVNYSELLPPVNPHNDEIIKTFGDQGGY